MSADGRRTGVLRSLGAVGFFVFSAAAPGTAELQAQSWSTMQLSRQLQAEEELSVEVKYGAGRFRVSPVNSRHLYRVHLRYDEEVFEPVHEYRDGALRIGVEGGGGSRAIRRLEGDGELDLELTRQVPMDLVMEFGAVKAELDLGGLRLRTLQLTTGASDAQLRVSDPNPIELDRAVFQVGAASFRARELGRLNARELQVDAGVGDVRLDLTGLHRADTRVKVSMGVGSVEIEVPRGVGIELTRSTFLTSVTAPDLTRRGDTWVSPEWDRADRKVRIQVDAAFGSITVRRVAP